MDKRDINTLSGRSFLAGINLAASGANYGHIQLYNIAASGVLVAVDRAIYSLVNTSFLFLRRYDTQLTGAPVTEANKLIGGATPTANVRTQNNASQFGTIIAAIDQSAATPFEFISPDDDPIILDEGQGILFVGNIVNVASAAIFHWREFA